MARGKAHDDEIRAQVIAALLTGAGVNDVARKLKLDKAVVSRIKSQLLPEQLQQVATDRAHKLGEAIADYLEQNIQAMKAICTVASDVEYLKNQSAAEVAELHDELATKAFRLLEAESIEEAEPAAE